MNGDYSIWIMMIAMFAIIYFFMIRPQNKKQKEIMNFRKNLEVGHNPENARRRGAEALRGLIISEQIKQSIQGGTANESTT